MTERAKHYADLIKRGGDLAEAGNFVGSEQTLRQATQLCPERTEGWNDLAVVLHLQGETNRAIELLGVATALEPANLEAGTNLVALYLAAGKPEEAATSARRLALEAADAPEAAQLLTSLGLETAGAPVAFVSNSTVHAPEGLEEACRLAGRRLVHLDTSLLPSVFGLGISDPNLWTQVLDRVRPCLVVVHEGNRSGEKVAEAANTLQIPHGVLGQQASIETIQKVMGEALESKATRATETHPLPAAPISVLSYSRDGLEDCLYFLDRISLQSLPAELVEVVLLDDASTPPLQEGLQSAAYPFELRIIRLESPGMAAAMERGRAEVRGRHQMFYLPHQLPPCTSLAGHVQKSSQAPSPVDTWIQELAEGRTFADLGGLWGTLNEKVTVAALAGASSATMLDYVPHPHQLWDSFFKRAEERGVSDYTWHQANVDDPQLAEKVGTYDLFHCSGVIYHVPNPIHTLLNLKSLAREYLIVTTVYVPNEIDTPLGSLRISDEFAYFVPNLEERTKAIFTAHYAQQGINPNTHPFVGVMVSEDQWLYEGDEPDYGPFWWLWTPGYVRRMLETIGLEVLDQGDIWPGKAVAFLCRVPPADQSGQD